MENNSANGNEQLDQEQHGDYLRHIRDLYDANKKACFQEMLIPETKPCTFSVTRITKLPWTWPPKEETYWQLKCFTTDDFNHQKKAEPNSSFRAPLIIMEG